MRSKKTTQTDIICIGNNTKSHDKLWTANITVLSAQHMLQSANIVTITMQAYGSMWMYMYVREQQQATNNQLDS